jgi:hypothetical protein
MKVSCQLAENDIITRGLTVKIQQVAVNMAFTCGERWFLVSAEVRNNVGLLDRQYLTFYRSQSDFIGFDWRTDTLREDCLCNHCLLKVNHKITVIFEQVIHYNIILVHIYQQITKLWSTYDKILKNRFRFMVSGGGNWSIQLWLIWSNWNSGLESTVDFQTLSSISRFQSSPDVIRLCPWRWKKHIHYGVWWG